MCDLLIEKKHVSLKLWLAFYSMILLISLYRNNAEEALQKLNGTVIGKQTVRLSWGRNPANKQFRADYGNQWSGAYYGGQLYDGYGYALPPPHDPSMYATPFAAYGAYPIYGNQQQVS
ncbi:polyadenylate-binding protein RBP47C-like [Quercus lobata]|uniref:polyadenylate-binding protein RBP47C-like n=1 Tax=Quercus lobata TaxID=97700 RepID=UPI001244B46C|nr:polyadenylate-binding protein RBP47C-like [Quercus lobata]XP_030972761.1 polyadenylate-binding protein RBP47C-like [Quercus lobata]